MIALILSALGIGSIAALIFIPGALPAIVKAATALWEAICKYPREAAIIALCGFSAWLWIGWGNADDRADTWKRAHDLRVKAEQLAEQAQKAMNAAHVAKAKEAANHADQIHAIETDRNRLAGRAYADTHRVRVQGCQASQGDPAASDRAPGVPEVAPAETGYVAVPARDVEQAVPDLYSYATACYAWGNELVAKGIAK